MFEYVQGLPVFDPKAASDTVPKLDDAALLAQKEWKGATRGQGLSFLKEPFASATTDLAPCTTAAVQGMTHICGS